jgi:hypothetical protein
MQDDFRVKNHSEHRKVKSNIEDFPISQGSLAFHKPNFELHCYSFSLLLFIRKRCRRDGQEEKKLGEANKKKVDC